MKIPLPYHKSFLELDIPDAALLGVLEPDQNSVSVPEFGSDPVKNLEIQREIIEKALSSPIGSPTLGKIAAGKTNAVIITSDHTRPVPSSITLPPMIRELRKANPEIDITILVATGMHRATTKKELLEKFGKEICSNEKIVMHDSQDNSSLVSLGKLPSGGELIINKLAVETELLLCDGFIEPHFFAGFSGGRKAVLPGIAGYKTVLANHCAEFIDSKNARTGVLTGNPIHKDMLFAAKSARLAFILNVVIDAEKRVIAAFAGDSAKAHEKGCKYVKTRSSVKKILGAKIVVTTNGGYPLDQNIYQSVKGMTAAEATCAEGGVIIIVSACSDGHGGESFYRHMAEADSPAEILEKISQVPMDKTLPEQWQFQILARILNKYTVIMVTDKCSREMIEPMHMNYAKTIPEALAMAHRIAGKDEKLAVIPDGVAVIVE